MQQVQIDGTMCRMPDNVDVSGFAVEPRSDDVPDGKPVELDPAFLAGMEVSAIITKLAHSDRDQSVARMAQYDALRRAMGVY